MTKLVNQPNANHETVVSFVRLNTKIYLQKSQKKKENKKNFILTPTMVSNFMFVIFGVSKQK